MDRLGAYRLMWMLTFMIVLLVSGCGESGGGGGMPGTGVSTDTILFPANYQTSYTPARSCRGPSIDHAGLAGAIQVYINLESLVDEYNDLPALGQELPVGTVLVKEVYMTSDCSGAILEWVAMEKEAPGYNPVGGDWYWQSVAPDRTILRGEDGIVDRCIMCHDGSQGTCVGFGDMNGYDYTCATP